MKSEVKISVNTEPLLTISIVHFSICLPFPQCTTPCAHSREPSNSFICWFPIESPYLTIPEFRSNLGNRQVPSSRVVHLYSKILLGQQCLAIQKQKQSLVNIKNQSIQQARKGNNDCSCSTKLPTPFPSEQVNFSEFGLESEHPQFSKSNLFSTASIFSAPIQNRFVDLVGQI